MPFSTRGTAILIAGLLLLMMKVNSVAQIDPFRRNLIHVGYDQPLVGQGPQALYAYYYYNNPEFIRTNMALRLAIAPLYLYGELGLKQLLSPYTDVGIGVYGGFFGDNYYEVQQGDYVKTQSFNGHGAGAALSIYHLLNPGMLIPLNIVARGGFKYTFYHDADDTAATFTLPPDRTTPFTLIGLRLAGKEPLLYPELGMELSVWFERQWRFGTGPYGFGGDRQVSPDSSLYWVYAGGDYSWTNIGHKVSLAVTAGGSTGTDRFSAWRPGGVLPLVAEFPLMLPGYYYQELTAERLVHLYGAYTIALDRAHRWEIRAEAASAAVDYLPGFEQTQRWQTGAGAGVTFKPTTRRFAIVVRYGYGFNALRDGEEGAHSVGFLFQYDFGPRKANT
jgi:hypothetical protein